MNLLLRFRQLGAKLKLDAGAKASDYSYQKPAQLPINPPYQSYMDHRRTVRNGGAKPSKANESNVDGPVDEGSSSASGKTSTEQADTSDSKPIVKKPRMEK